MNPGDFMLLPRVKGEVTIYTRNANSARNALKEGFVQGLHHVF